MKILVFGAGVIGCLYAAKLYEAGIDITLLARGETFENLQQNGVIINNILTGKQIAVKIPLTQQINPADYYDLIIVTVRLDQIESAKNQLQQNISCPAILFMLNNPDNLQHLTDEFPGKKIILGFPGAGGTFHDSKIDYVQIKEQKTTIGDIEGHITALTKEVKSLFERAGFKVALCDNMRAWLITHAVFIACVSAAIIKENGDSIRLGKNRKNVQIMVWSIKEGFKACKQLGIPILPANLKTIFLTMPQWFSVSYWQKALQGKTGTLAIAPHANAAKGEMQLLAEKVLDIVHSSTFATPTLDDLLTTFILSTQNKQQL